MDFGVWLAENGDIEEAARRLTVRKAPDVIGYFCTTVSFVLNEREDARISSETRQRVLDAAEQLGYHVHAPARQLAEGASRTVGLVLRQSPEHVAADALLPETLRGLVAAARSGRYRVLVEPLPPGGGTYAGLVRSRQADGLVISGPRSDDDELRQLAEDGFPIVLQGTLDGVDVPSVDVDNRAAAARAVGHLTALGHRRIACITNAALAYTAAADRLRGYRDGIATAGIEADERLIVEGDFDSTSGERAMRQLLELDEPPTAVFAASDVVAFGVLSALREAGLRVPVDISLVGFDDIALAAYADPPMTTIHTPAFELGEAAGQLVLDLVGGRSVRSRTVLPTELYLRQSTGPPPPRRARSPVQGAWNGFGGP